MSDDRPPRGFFAQLTTADAAKLLITAFFLPCIAFLIYAGSDSNNGSMVGLGIAMVGVLGAFWGAPKRGGGDGA